MAERALIRKAERELARDQLRSLRERIERTGNGFDVLRAISVCAMRDVVMPEWLAIEFMTRYRQVTHARVATWDEAFDRPLPKGTHLAALRSVREKGPKVYRAVKERNRRGEGIGKALFSAVGEARGIGLSATKVEELYYEEKKLRERLPRKS